MEVEKDSTAANLSLIHTINAKKGASHARRPRGAVVARRAVICASSGAPLIENESTSFPCPGCSTPIGRSQRCRVQAVKYICSKCRFEGP